MTTGTITVSGLSTPSQPVTITAYVPGTVDMALHVAASDPHPQYLTSTEGDAAYDASGAAAAVQSALTTHTGRTDNPHAVTKAQVGLGNVDDTSDASKPVSTAQAEADAAVQAFSIQRANHTGFQAISTVTGLQTELDGKQSSLGYTAENTANKGVVNGYAGLDGSGKVPASQLPSYVDDVIEAASVAALPGTGETGKIYVALDTGKVYRWSGSAYVEISAAPGSTDAVPEGATNLYHTASRVNTLISAAVGSVVQAYSATLTSLAALTTTAFGRSLLTLADAAALRTSIVLPTSTTVGRLARYTDTAGAQGQTSGLFEDASGNVGIGTTSPDTKLTVRASTGSIARIAAFTTPGMAGDEKSYISLGDSSTSNNAFYLAYNHNSNAASRYFAVTPFESAPGTKSFVLNANGNVGIGTTSPSTTLHANGPIRTASYTVATLPSAATVGAGSRAYVTDATATTFGTVVVGGGSNKMPVYSDGTNWLIG